MTRSVESHCPHCGGDLPPGGVVCPYCRSTLSGRLEARIHRQWTIVRNIIVFYAVYLGSILPLFWLSGKDRIYGMMVISVVDVGIILGFRSLAGESLAHMWRFDRKIWGATALGLLLLPPLLAVNLGYHGLLKRLFDLHSEPISGRFSEFGLGMAVVVFFVCLMPAVWEEVAFRGLILGRLQEVVHTREAVVLTSVLFAVIHAAPLSWGYLFLLGAVMGVLRLYGRSLWPAAVFHFLHNLAVILLEFHGI